MALSRRNLIVSFSALPGTALAQLVKKPAAELKNGEFNWHPERSTGGPLLIIVSIPDQLVHVYRNGIRIAASTCSTGKQGHRTPTGVFKVLQKDKHHRSSTYSNAPMPNMNRLTWSGIALHAGNLPGYPASHGCVRLPLQFSELLFGITKLGMTVVIADDHSQPSSVTHPGMVLGDYARHEFQGASAALATNRHGEDHGTHTSVIVSSADRSVTIFENEKIVATGSAHIENSHQPLPESVHKLVEADAKTGHMKWTSIAHGKTLGQDLTSELQRIKVEPKLRPELRKRLHHGMTVVTTAEKPTAQHRTSAGFVVVEGLY